MWLNGSEVPFLAPAIVQEPWRYNAYLKRLKERVDQKALRPINMRLGSRLHVRAWEEICPKMSRSSNPTTDQKNTAKNPDGVMFAGCFVLATWWQAIGGG